LSGENEAELVIANLGQAAAGSYTAKITNWAGISTSAAATVTVAAAVVPDPGDVPTGSNPTNPGVRVNQSVMLRLPTSLKKKKKYVLPATTLQGPPAKWALKKNKYCKVKKNVLRCTVSSKKKKITLKVSAPGTTALHPFAQFVKRRVK